MKLALNSVAGSSNKRSDKKKEEGRRKKEEGRRKFIQQVVGWGRVFEILGFRQ
jgi:hypothetical protein